MQRSEDAAQSMFSQSLIRDKHLTAFLAYQINITHSK